MNIPMLVLCVVAGLVVGLIIALILRGKEHSARITAENRAAVSETEARRYRDDEVPRIRKKLELRDQIIADMRSEISQRETALAELKVVVRKGT